MTCTPALEKHEKSFSDFEEILFPLRLQITQPKSQLIPLLSKSFSDFEEILFPLRLQITQPKSHLIPLQGPRLVILAKGIWLHENLNLRSRILRGHTKTILLKISVAFQFEIFKASSSDILYEY